MTPEPRYWRVFSKDRHELEDKTPESEIYVSWADYRKAVAQQERCAGQTANEWRALWVQQAKQDAAKGVEIKMLRIAVEAMRERGNRLMEALSAICAEVQDDGSLIKCGMIADEAIRSDATITLSPDGQEVGRWVQGFPADGEGNGN
jgi:hypothetical protein